MNIRPVVDIVFMEDGIDRIVPAVEQFFRIKSWLYRIFCLMRLLTDIYAEKSHPASGIKVHYRIFRGTVP